MIYIMCCPDISKPLVVSCGRYLQHEGEGGDHHSQLLNTTSSVQRVAYAIV